MNVTGSSNRIYYKRPSPDVNPKQMYGEFQFVVDSGRASNGYTTASVSYPGTITLVPLDGAYITSDFMLNDEGWMIIGNKQSTSR